MTIASLTACVTLLLATPGLVMAHEHRTVGRYEMTVGWVDEPTYAGFKNAVQLFLHDASGKVVNDLGDTLKVEVIFGTQKTGPLGLDPAFDLEEHLGTPGAYQAAVIPTRPGNYTFHFTGSIKGQKVDQSFTSSEKTFDPVKDASEIEFPAKDPSRADLTMRLERLSPRVDVAEQAAAQTRTLAIAGIVLGALGLVVGLAARRRRYA
jgi:hypothetical protein